MLDADAWLRRYLMLAGLAVATTLAAGALVVGASFAGGHGCNRFSDLCGRTFGGYSLDLLSVAFLGATVVIVCIRGGRVLARGAWATYRLRRGLPLLQSWAADVRVVDDPAPRAFVLGLLRPRVYLSQGTLDLLEPAQLLAVVDHERHHARRRDPLRQLVTQAAVRALFFVPALRLLPERCAALAEVRADRAALANGRDVAPLAQALLRFEAVSGVEPERVDALMGDRVRWPRSWSFRLWLVGLAFALVSLLTRVGEMAVGMSFDATELGRLLCNSALVAVPAAVVAVSVGRLLRAPRLP